MTALSEHARDNKPVRILICDDSESARKGLRAALSTWAELEVVADVSNGADALKSVNDDMPDVVLMDANMPVMNGIKATRTIKSRWPQIRVIVISMYPRFREEAVRAGADLFLTKGSDLEGLVDAILR